MTKQISRRRAMVLGAVVADAAALGLHWIYAQPRIRHIAGDTPEFHEPKRENYDGVPGYFAHELRHAGDNSMYGESLLVVLRSLSETGMYDRQHYARAFEQHFGFGGEYVGYIDTPTRETLTNMILEQRELLDAALRVPFSGTEKVKQSVAKKVMASARLVRGDALKRKVEDAVRTTKGDDEQIRLAHDMIEVLERARSFPGADDVQLPALTKVPVLVAAFPDAPDLETMVEDAVRVTNNNDEAVAWALFHTRLLRWTLTENASIETLEDGIHAAAEDSPEFVKTALQNMVRRRNEDNKTVTMKLGPACELKSGVPVALHNLLAGESYQHVVRRNILACGDSCGRAMIVGSVAGSLFAEDAERRIPEEWIEKTSRAGVIGEHLQDCCAE